MGRGGTRREWEPEGAWASGVSISRAGLGAGQLPRTPPEHSTRSGKSLRDCKKKVLEKPRGLGTDGTAPWSHDLEPRMEV